MEGVFIMYQPNYFVLHLSNVLWIACLIFFEGFITIATEILTSLILMLYLGIALSIYRFIYY